jgi:hypothetical protein
MQQSLRRGNIGVHVTYRRFGNTDSLWACDFTLEADEKRVLFSMDFSASERTRNKESNLYIDVQSLIENSADVHQFELPREKWLDPLAAALKQHRNASRELEIRFKDSPSRTYRYALDVDDHRICFVVLSE